MLVKIVTFQWNKMNSETLLSMKSGVLSLILVVMAACSAPEKLSESKKSVLIQRVSDRWQCLERNDYDCAYEFTSPAYRRVFSREMYVNRYFSQTERILTGVNLVAYDRDAAVASVRVGVMSGPLKNTPSASRGIAVTPLSLDEAWLQSDGKWWYYEGP
jgi:hypothetical protein